MAAVAMSLHFSHPNTLLLLNHKSLRNPVSASLHSGVQTKAETNLPVLCVEEAKHRIRELFSTVELSVSAYDTAWVAMVPSQHSSLSPCFPECVNWLLDNQLNDGSWGPHHCDSLLLKDKLSSTLACILSLKQWGVGQEQIDRGMSSATYLTAHRPPLFSVEERLSFLQYAIDMDLNLSLEPKDMDAMFQKRNLELRRCYNNDSKGKKAYLAYVSEGIVKSQDWDMVMKYQRKNGSLFNSPATTAAALAHLQSASCLNYLQSILDKYGNAVPTVFPLEIYARLCMVDNLQRLGIDHHFKEVLRSVLDETYRCWLQGEEEIFMDIATCALAFRLLRVNGYDVSSDKLTQLVEEDFHFDSLGSHVKSIHSTLEVYKASQMVIYPNELALEKQNSWSRNTLEQELTNGSVLSDKINRYISQEVYDALNFPSHANLDRVAHWRNIQRYNVDATRILKTSFCSSNFSNQDFLMLAVEDFKIWQSMHGRELKLLERWFVENRLDKLKFARQRLAYCYFTAAATLFSPELSDARMSWAKNCVLTTVVDDFFDVGGSVEELVNLIQLIEKWNVNLAPDCCSEQVQIVFSALHSTISKIGDKAFTRQRCHVTSHIITIWLDLLNSMLKEAEWVRDMSLPTMDEYMSNGYVSFALGPILLPTIYFLGPKVEAEMVKHTEIHKLFKLTSICGRLLNDTQTHKRELSQGKLNAVRLHMIHNKVTEEQAIREISDIINSQRRELLRLVLQEKDSLVPKACKDLFWNMSKVTASTYMESDGYTSDEILKAVKALINEPISFDKVLGRQKGFMN